MKLDKQKILQLTENVVSEADFFLIDIDYRGDSRNQIIEIYIDSALGISAEDCKMISKKLDDLLYEHDLVQGKYRLDVSSPGVDRPLKYLEQYSKHINRNFEIEYIEAEEIKNIKAKLVEIKNNNLVFSVKKDKIMLDFNNINSAKVLASF